MSPLLAEYALMRARVSLISESDPEAFAFSYQDLLGIYYTL